MFNNPENPQPPQHGRQRRGSLKKKSEDSEQPGGGMEIPPELLGTIPFRDPPIQQQEPLVQLPLPVAPVQEKKVSVEDLKKGGEAVIVAEPDEPQVDIDYAEEWLHSFLWMRIFLIVLGRWPFTYTEEKNVYRFKFTWKCPGFFLYVLTTLITTYGLIAAGINVAAVLMNEKIKAKQSRSTTEKLEQALIERHTMVVIIMLGSYGVSTITSFFIFAKRNEMAEMMTKWLKILRSAKLSGGTMHTYSYVGLVFINYLIVNIILLLLTIIPSPVRTSTLIGGPTAISMLFMRHFNRKNYMEDYTGSGLHMTMSILGMILFFYIITVFHAYMYLFLWLSKSIEIAFSGWNDRMGLLLELTANELIKKQNKKERTTYELLFADHIGIVRMLSWTNDVFAYSLETYVLFQTIKVVYQMYLAVLVLDSNGESPTYQNVGEFFMRPKDYLPALLITYENAFTIVTMLMAGSYLEDTAGDSYDDLRKKSLLKGYYNEKETYFFLSMFQSYTSTTKMAIHAGQFFCIDRYTILHVLSAVVSNFLVVYQFRPLFDSETAKDKDLRDLIGAFLTKFEGLPLDHLLPKPEED